MSAPFEEFLAHLEEEAGRLPRSVAYPLIFAVSIAIWLPIGIALFSCVSP
jgi:hypothetical protein